MRKMYWNCLKQSFDAWLVWVKFSEDGPKMEESTAYTMAKAVARMEFMLA